MVVNYLKGKFVCRDFLEFRVKIWWIGICSRFEELNNICLNQRFGPKFAQPLFQKGHISKKALLKINSYNLRRRIFSRFVTL